MSLTRPRRQAATNKSYNDAIDESIFEENASNPSNNVSNSTKKKSTKGSTPEPNNKKANSKSIPYNWQPPPLPVDYFSYKLDLTDAYIDLKDQILYCPDQPPIPNSYEQQRRRKLKEPFKLVKGDYIYMISEPPGEPYYIGRIMGFKSKHNRHNHHAHNNPDPNADSTSNLESDIPVTPKQQYEDAKEYVFQIQWFYRPRDISKSTSDSRLLYASMHTDTCPLQSFRGLITVKHKQDVEYEYKSITESANGNGKSASPISANALEMYSQQPNSFYFDKLFDRYMIKFYDIIPTAELLRSVVNDENKSKNFLIALNKRFEFVFVETNRTKSFVNGFSSNSCNCEICGQWCSGQDSVNCAGCDKHYHMYCLDPPLLRKPSRGFSWSCAPCTKKHDLEHQSKKMVMLSHDNKLSNERELNKELNVFDSRNSSPKDLASEVAEEADETEDEEEEIKPQPLPKYELMAIDFLSNDSHLSFEQRRLKEEWCMRYLGMYSRLEDGVDLEDRSPYPRASTRLGAKHQATNIPEFYDHPIVYYDLDKQSNGNNILKKKPSTKKPTTKSKKHDSIDTTKLPVPEEFKDVPPKEFPHWLQPRPKGYIERGVDDGDGLTCTLMWKPSEEDKQDNFSKLDSYIEMCSPIAKKLNMFANSPNFVDEILKHYLLHNGNIDEAYDDVSKLTRKSLREPTFTKEEVKRFEAGVKKYGSELYPVYKEVKTKPLAMVVRFYYLWKKTENGRLIWGNFEGRMQKKLQNTVKDEHVSKSTTKNGPGIDDLADPEDDSSYEVEKIHKANTKLTCKHCHTSHSLQWFRITGYDANTKLEEGTHEDLDKSSVIGLCFRCARLWRRYAVIWEDPNEVDKKNNKPVGGWKKKMEYELVRDSQLILEESDIQGGGLSFENIQTNSSILNGSASRSKKSATAKKADPPTLSAKTASSLKTKVTSEKIDETITKKRKSSTSTTKIPATIKKPTTAKTKAQAKTTKTGAPKQTKSKKDESSQKTSESSKATKNKKLSAVKDEMQNNELKTEPANLKDNNLKPKRKRKLANTGDDTKPSKKTTSAVKKEEMTMDNIQSSSISPGPTKRQKKTIDPSLSNRLINPVTNNNYKISSPVTSKLDKKTTPVMTEELLRNIIKSYKAKQLTDLGSQLHAYQIPNNATIELPFPVDARNCCVCLEQDNSMQASLEMLVCSNCGVNVHISCAGISIPDNIPRPIKQWLCEPCINDLNPHHSTLYSCCLCLANESNYELSILGHPSVKPDYLKPIYESGRWCHLVCALFNSDLINFRSIPSTAFNLKRLVKDDLLDQYSVIESMHNFTALESVSEIYLRYYSTRCGICKSSNGSLVGCTHCESSGSHCTEKYHITCAQDTPNFKLGFKLQSQRVNDKDNRVIKVDKEYGKLKPVLDCGKHGKTAINIYGLRTMGKRVYGITKDELKPIIQIYLEDIVKTSQTNNKLTGPQFKSNTYVNMLKVYEEQERSHTLNDGYLKILNLSNIISIKKSENIKTCERCSTTASPMWWIKHLNQTDKKDDVPELANQKFICQTCYHIRDEDSEATPESESLSLLDMLNEPLNGENYGLKDCNDNLTDVYKPEIKKEELQTPTLEHTRSRITIGDILS